LRRRCDAKSSTPRHSGADEKRHELLAGLRFHERHADGRAEEKYVQQHELRDQHAQPEHHERESHHPADPAFSGQPETGRVLQHGVGEHGGADVTADPSRYAPPGAAGRLGRIRGAMHVAQQEQRAEDEHDAAVRAHRPRQIVLLPLQHDAEDRDERKEEQKEQPPHEVALIEAPAHDDVVGRPRDVVEGEIHGRECRTDERGVLLVAGCWLLGVGRDSGRGRRD
jgi:hypothetical protein